MKLVFALGALAMGLVPLAPAGAQPHLPPLCLGSAQYALAYDDEFTSFDTSKYMVGYPWGPGNIGAKDDAFYRASQISVTPQGLALSAVPASSPYPQFQGTELHYFSGGFNTNVPGGYNQKYGYFETSMKLPGGQGMWPAFWLFDSKWSAEEYDIMEELNGQNTIHHTGHAANAVGHATFQNNGVMASSDPTQKFHTYGLLWTPKEITWYLDGVPGLTAPLSDVNSMWIIFDNAVGATGSWPGAPNASTTWPQKLYVRYLRVYRSSGQRCSR
jgi:beta-glucanase (GH16 family)